VSRVIENPMALLSTVVFHNRRVLRFANGFEFEVSAKNWWLAERLVRLAYYGAELTEGGNEVPLHWQVFADAGLIKTPEGILFKLSNMEPFTLAETFIYNIHFAPSNLEGRVVVDAGAFTGDSVLNFAYQGAEVYAYEPDPTNFRALEENLRLNPRLSPRIHPFQYAVGKDGVTNFHGGLEGGSGVYSRGGRVVRVPSISLDTILRENHLSSPAFLKLDCKGTEYDLVEQEGLACFPVVSIEYSADLRGRTVLELQNKLTQRGFHRIRIYKHHWLYFSILQHGMIRAEK
jgi:FkbM family methyltransferase